mgnify:CR=1 FL=1
MSDVRHWSSTDASNNATAPDGYPEGMQAGKLNDSGRAVMGGVRRLAEDIPWLDFGDSVSRASANSFNASGTGTLSARYYANRRVKLTGTLTGTIYGTIASTAGSFLVTVTLDSGTIQADSDLKCFIGLPADNPAASTQSVAGLQALLDALVPVGTVHDYAGSAAPSKFVLCDGAAISRTTYSVLFGVVGTTFGAGDGSTTFNVPDLRGRVVAGKDDMGGIAASRLTAAAKPALNGTILGAAGGVEEHAITKAEMQPHVHTENQGAQQFNNAEGGGGDYVNNNSATNTGDGSADGLLGEAHTNVQPTIVLNKIIYTGVV